MPHKIFTSAIEHINFSSADTTTITTIPLATATHSFFHALAPVFVDSLFLTPKQIEFFCDRCPTYQYATSILLCGEKPFKTEKENEDGNENENEDETNEVEQQQQEQHNSIDADFFARVAAPMRFLKTVRFHSSLFKLIRADLGVELVKLNFLEDAYLFQTSIVKITVSEFYDLSEDENIADKLQDDQFLVLRSLVFDHPEETVNASAAIFTTDVLWQVSDFVPVQSLLLRGANNNQDNNNPSSFPLLEKLFSLLKHPVKSENSWGSYINFLTVLVDGRDDVLFEEHISPHLDVLFHLLDLRSTDILDSIGYFFNGLIAHRTENDQQKQQQMLGPLFECGLVPDLLEAVSQSLARIRKEGGRVSSALVNVIAVYSRGVGKSRLHLASKNEIVLELLKDRLTSNNENDDEEVRTSVCTTLIYFFQVRADKERGWVEVKLTPELLSLLLDNALNVQAFGVHCRAMDCLAVLTNFNERMVHWQLERFYLISQFKERFVLAGAMFFLTSDQITRPSTEQNDDDEDDENDDANAFTESLQDARHVKRILFRIFGSYDKNKNKLPPARSWNPEQTWRFRLLLRFLTGLAKWELFCSRLLLTKARVIEMLRRADAPPSFDDDFSARLSLFTDSERQGLHARNDFRINLLAFNDVASKDRDHAYFNRVSSTLKEARNVAVPESSPTIDALTHEMKSLHDALHTFHKKVYKTVTTMPLRSDPKSLLFQQQEEDRRVYSESEWNSLLSKMFDIPSHTASGAQQPKSEDDIDDFVLEFLSMKPQEDIDLLSLRSDTASTNLLKSLMKWNSEGRRPLFYTAVKTLYDLRLEEDTLLSMEEHQRDACAIDQCHQFYRLTDDAKKMFMYRSRRRSSKK